MSLTDVQRKHQPKYVLAELDRLERNVAHLERKLKAVGQDSGDIIVGPYSKTPIFIDGDESVQFNLDSLPSLGGRPNNIMVQRQEYANVPMHLIAMAAETIVVEAQSSNVVKLFSERRR